MSRGSFKKELRKWKPTQIKCGVMLLLWWSQLNCWKQCDVYQRNDSSLECFIGINCATKQVEKWFNCAWLALSFQPFRSWSLINYDRFTLPCKHKYLDALIAITLFIWMAHLKIAQTSSLSKLLNLSEVRSHCTVVKTKEKRISFPHWVSDAVN